MSLPISGKIRERGDNYFVDVYRFTMNIKEEDLHLQTEETDGYMFASKEQIEAFCERGNIPSL